MLTLMLTSMSINSDSGFVLGVRKLRFREDAYVKTARPLLKKFRAPALQDFDDGRGGNGAQNNWQNGRFRMRYKSQYPILMSWKCRQKKRSRNHRVHVR